MLWPVSNPASTWIHDRRRKGSAVACWPQLLVKEFTSRIEGPEAAIGVSDKDMRLGALWPVAFRLEGLDGIAARGTLWVRSAPGSEGV